MREYKKVVSASALPPFHWIKITRGSGNKHKTATHVQMAPQEKYTKNTKKSSHPIITIVYYYVMTPVIA